MIYKAISLWQPWATLIAIGAKRFETRSWYPHDHYRGPIVIHAAKKWDSGLNSMCFDEPFFSALTAGRDKPLFKFNLPLGCALAIADLTHVYRSEAARADQSEQELAFGDWSPGRFVWEMENVRPFPEPIPVKGAQGLFTVELDLEGITS
jgi:hypothetical protein